MLNVEVITILAMLIISSTSQPQVIVDHRDTYTKRHNNLTFHNYYVDMGLVIMGLILIVI